MFIVFLIMKEKKNLVYKFTKDKEIRKGKNYL